jgi:Zn-dependent protease
MYFDKRMLYVAMAIMVIWGLSSYLTDVNSLLGLLYTIPGVLIAITFHEFAHAKVADMLGDDTPRREGRVSLNPLSHIDPIGFIMLLFAGFGWGKPVNVNPRNYNRDITVEKADCIVSIAGPAMNFILSIIFTIIYFIIYKFASSFVYSQVGYIIMQMIMYTITINIGLGVFNLIPLPPLDGSKVIKPLLGYNAKQWFENNEKIFYIIFVVLWITGIAGNIISPIIKLIFNGLMKLGNLILGL